MAGHLVGGETTRLPFMSYLHPKEKKEYYHPAYSLRGLIGRNIAPVGSSLKAHCRSLTYIHNKRSGIISLQDYPETTR